MMEGNSSCPIPPNKSEGCHNCGGGKNQILKSRKVPRISISTALCDPCFELPDAALEAQPFNARGK